MSAYSISLDQLLALGSKRLGEILLRECITNNELRKRVMEAVAARTSAETEAQQNSDADEDHMVGSSPPMLKVFESIRRFASTDAPILITGESGTGKELAALAIHERSQYRSGPFMAINCAGIPPTLIASELFGHEKGAFTGAHERRIGRIEAAAGGTLFLDEIGDLPVDLQPHLLRFLQERTILRIGGNRAIKLDVRILSATHQDLPRLIAADRFREDLFYRLNVLSIEMPPLRDRDEDLELLGSYLLKKINREMERSIRGFDPGAVQALHSHSWPGNVRELISSIRRAVVVAEGDWITAADLGLESQIEAPARVTAPPNGEKVYSDRSELGGSTTQPHLTDSSIREALAKHHQNVSRAAKYLGVSRVTLYRHMRKHSILAARDD